METEGYVIDCNHDHIYMIEVILDRYSKTDWKEKKFGDEEEEEEDEAEEEEDEEEGVKKNPIEIKDPKDCRPIILNVKYFNTDEIVKVDNPSIYIDTPEEVRQLRELREIENEKDELRKEDDKEVKKEEEEEEENKRKIIFKKFGDEVAGTLTPGLKYCSGKSRLFPMKPYTLIEKMKRSSLNVTFYWKPMDGVPMSKIGETDIMLGKDFMDCVAKVDAPVPLSVFTEDKYTLRNEKGETGGFVKLFIRLTCYGKAQYHIPEPEI